MNCGVYKCENNNGSGYCECINYITLDENGCCENMFIREEEDGEKGAVQAMSDEEIKKCLECCAIVDWRICSICPLNKTDNCHAALAKGALDIINQQQAEIERLQELVAEWKKVSYTYADSIEKIKSEAIKEFAERFIDEECAYCSSESDEMIFFKERFNNFLAEMAGGENA